MINFGNGLQRKYSNGVSGGNNKSEREKLADKKDREALRKASAKKRARREARMEARMNRNIAPDVAVEILENDPMNDHSVKSVIKEAYGKSNAIAREYGLAEPNHPEALKHDRLHCMMCDRKLDNPNAGNSPNSPWDDEEIRLMCCWCFGKMSDIDIRREASSGKDANAEIRLKVYNPEESSKEEIESLIESKMIQLRGKLKRWEQDVRLVGNVKHDYLHEGDQLENSVMYNAKTRYNACSW
jgi:hypothetical protein